MTRCAEVITVFALMIGAMFPIIHLGRPWLAFWLFPYPSERLIWPNFRSPLVWDFFAINTYLTGSVLFLFLPMIPDFAVVRDKSTGLAPAHLHAAGARLARHAEAVAPARDGDGDHGGRDRAGRRLRSHHRVVRLLDGAGSDVAVHDLRPLLRGRRDLQRHRRSAHRDGDPAARAAPRAVPAPDSLREPGQAAARDGAALGLLRLQRASRHLLRQRALGNGGVLADAARIVRTALLDDGDRQLRAAAGPHGHQAVPHDHRLRHRVDRRHRRHVARALPDHRSVARAQVPAVQLRHLPAAAGGDHHRRRHVCGDGAAVRVLRQGRADHLDLGAQGWRSSAAGRAARTGTEEPRLRERTREGGLRTLPGWPLGAAGGEPPARGRCARPRHHHSVRAADGGLRVRPPRQGDVDVVDRVRRAASSGWRRRSASRG